MNPDLDALATALYVRIDDLLAANPQWAPERPAVGIAPALSDAELVTLAVLQALLGFDSEARFVRYARTHLKAWFPYVPQRPGYNRRLRRAGETMPCDRGAGARVPVVARRRVAGGLHARRARPQPTDPAALRPRRMGRLRLLRLALKVLLGAAPAPHRHTGGAANRLRARRSQHRRARHAPRDDRPRPDRPEGPDPHRRQGIPLSQLRTWPQHRRHHTHTARHQNRASPTGRSFLKPLRQIIESVNSTLKAQLGLERHRGRTRTGVAARILQRILALTAAIWHNQTTQQPGPARSLIAYDH